jgi:hypothetical protein
MEDGKELQEEDVTRNDRMSSSMLLKASPAFGSAVIQRIGPTASESSATRFENPKTFETTIR